MQKQLRIFLAGVMVITPLAVTVWIVWALGSWLEDVGRSVLPYLGEYSSSLEKLPPGVGAVAVIVAIYLVGLLTHFWVFRGLLNRVDQLVSHVPGIKTIYESVRDLLKLFGGESSRMGRVVRYTVPGTEASTLAVLTNEHPEGTGHAESDKVAVYLPFSYMFGGMTVFVSPEHIEEVDMPVEKALKLCATAQVSSAAAKVDKALKGEGAEEEEAGSGKRETESGKRETES